MKKILFILSLVLTLATLLTACSGGKCATSGKSVLDLDMSAPSQYPSGSELDIPVIVTNVGKSDLSNIVYSVPSNLNNTGVLLAVTDQSQAKCSTLAVGQSCQLTVHMPAGSKPGSFSVSADSASLSAEQSVFIGLVNIPLTTGVGVDGITLLYPSKISGSTNCDILGTQNVLIAMAVTSESVGSFNNLQLVDSNGNILPYEVLTGNSGQGMTSLSVGSVVTLDVKIPCGSSQLVFKSILKSDNNNVPNGIGKNPEVVDIVPPTIKQAILSISPSLVNLNQDQKSQVVTVVNIGNANASNLGVTIVDSNVIITNNTCIGNLAVNTTCSYTVSFDVTKPIVGTTNGTISYNDNIANSSLNAVVNYQGISPVVGLTVNSNNLGYNFNATTESPTYSSLVTLTNAGDVLPLTLDNWPTATYFNISTNAGTGNDCTDNQVLQPGQSCNILLTYNNSTVASSTDNLTFGFSYTDIDSINKTGLSIVDLNYSTIQSVAVLSYDASTYALGTIVNNGVDFSQQTIIVTNIGQVAANSISSILSKQYVSLESNQCGSSLTNGQSCNITVQLGPVGSSTGLGASSGVQGIKTVYLPYPTSLSRSSVQASLTGSVTTAQTAILTTDITSTSGFESGSSGLLSNPYQVQNNMKVAPTVTYTLKNSGNVPANQFYISYDASIIQPWSITSNGCGTQASPVTLAENGGSCTITFTLNTSSVGMNNLNMSNIHMSWVDQDSPNGQTQNGTEILYANVFAAPLINVSISPSTISYNQNAVVTFTLTGGYNVIDQSVSITGSTPNDGNLIYSNGTTCIVSQNTSSCSLVVSQSNYITQGYSLAFNNVGTVNLNTYSLGLNVVITPFVFSSPRQIAVTPNESDAFITNNSNNTVTHCKIVNNNFVNCTNSGATGLSKPFGVTLNPAGTYAFISNFDRNTITKCSVSNGILNNCNVDATNISSPYWLSLNNSGVYMFIGNLSSTITQCTLSVNSLTGCGNSGGVVANGMKSVTVNSSGTYAFVTNYSAGTVLQCAVSGSSLSGCAASGASAISGPVMLTLNSSGTYAFITNYTSSIVTQCSVSGGTLSNCANSGATNLNGPEGIVLNSAGTYAYITNIANSSNNIMRCSVSGNSFSNCVQTGFK